MVTKRIPSVGIVVRKDNMKRSVGLKRKTQSLGNLIKVFKSIKLIILRPKKIIWLL